MNLAQILPKIWHKLKPRPLSPKSTRNLIDELAERERRIDNMKRAGLGNHAAENLYRRPKQLQD